MLQGVQKRKRGAMVWDEEAKVTLENHFFKRV